MSSNHLVVLCTCPDGETAQHLARQVVEGRLAACVNIVPGVTSVFYWEGEAQSEQEHLLVIKTSDITYTELESKLAELHPYELPEIIAVGIERGLAGFLDWIRDETS